MFEINFCLLPDCFKLNFTFMQPTTQPAGDELPPLETTTGPASEASTSSSKQGVG